MPIGPIIAFQFIVFVGLILFMRYILSGHVSRATNRLQGLVDDYTAKQKEIDILLEKAKKESQDMIIKAKTEAGVIRSKILKKTQEEKEKTLNDAKQKSEHIIEQAEKAGESIRLELEGRIEKRAMEDAQKLIQHALPDKFKQELHSIWMREFGKVDLQMNEINLPKDTNEAQISSAFPLTNEQKRNLVEKIKEKIGRNFSIKEKLDSELIAGFVITIGSVVIDGSLRHRIQNTVKEL